MIPPFSLVVGYEIHTRGIGLKDTIPWDAPEDKAQFARITKEVDPDSLTWRPTIQNAIIMGRKTWESMGKKSLPGRLNVVISSDENITQVRRYVSLEQALESLGSDKDVHRIFVIGGQALYQAAISMVQCRKIYATVLTLSPSKQEDICFDTFMPKFEHEFTLMTVSEKESKNGHTLSFRLYERQHQELQYLDLLTYILASEKGRNEKFTTLGTVSVIAPQQLRFDLSSEFPLLTTKRVLWNVVVAELLWSLGGQTDSKLLEQKGVTLWQGNTSRSYYENVEPGDTGPGCGFCWRHFGAEYYGCGADYTGKGFDQIKWLETELKKEAVEPSLRQLLLINHHPSKMDWITLPTCHVAAHFTVTDDKKLICVVFVKGCDVVLGLPHTIASYALLTKQLAHVSDLQAGSLVITISDAHLFHFHVEAVLKQLKKLPSKFPTVILDESVKTMDDWKPEHIHLHDYNPTVNGDMAM